MKVIVFGGSGFLGSHISDKLTDLGHDVIIYDINKSPYLRPKQKMVVGNILDEEKVKDSVSGCGIVFNFAGLTDIEESFHRPLESVKSNILGNTIILEACRKAKVKRFIYASSLYVYSRKGSFYRSAKQACELIIENYNEVFGLPYTIIRYGSLYGPRADERNFIFRIIKQALSDGRIAREGDGEEIREYIHVYDAAKCSVDILDKEFENQYIIITGNQQMKVKDLLFMINEILGGRVKIDYLKPRSVSHYEMSPYSFTPKLAKRLISKSYVDLGQGILKLIQNLYKEINSPSSCNGLVISKAAKKK